jgi:hypothetical protein
MPSSTLILETRSLAQSSTITPVSVDPGGVVGIYAIGHPTGSASTETGLILPDGRILRIAAALADVASALEIASDSEYTAISASPLGLHDAEVVGGVVAAQLSSAAVVDQIDAFAGVKWHRIGSGRIGQVIA